MPSKKIQRGLKLRIKSFGIARILHRRNLHRKVRFFKLHITMCLQYYVKYIFFKFNVYIECGIIPALGSLRHKDHEFEDTSVTQQVQSQPETHSKTLSQTKPPPKNIKVKFYYILKYRYSYFSIIKNQVVRFLNIASIVTQHNSFLPSHKF